MPTIRIGPAAQAHELLVAAGASARAAAVARGGARPSRARTVIAFPRRRYTAIAAVAVAAMRAVRRRLRDR